MSFSGDVKTELCRAPLNRKCCAQAEVYGVLLCCNTYTRGEVRIVTENPAFAKRLPALFRKAFGLTFDRLPSGEGKQIFSMTDPEKLAAVREVLGGDSGGVALHLNFAVLDESCCRTAFLRGAFLAGGSVTDPRKGYHLELSTSHLNVGREAMIFMRDMELEPKAAQRHGSVVIYFKQSGRIEDFLTAIGAPVCAMEMMNARLEKDLRGSVNRRVNCDAANLDKAVEAAMTQVEAIKKLEERGQLASLPDKLREAARLRREHPEDTLAQLAERCDPPVTKSALNHRLRKLVELGKEGLEKYRDLPLEQVGSDSFRYGYRGEHGGAWVLIKREENGLWYYVRLGHVSESKRFYAFQACLDEAYEDILRSKY